MKLIAEPKDVQQAAQEIIKEIKNHALPEIIELVKIVGAADELLNKTQVLKLILHCKADNADEDYFNDPDFPFIPGRTRIDGTTPHDRYLRSSVIEYLKKRETTRRKLYS